MHVYKSFFMALFVATCMLSGCAFDNSGAYRNSQGSNIEEMTIAEDLDLTIQRIDLSPSEYFLNLEQYELKTGDTIRIVSSDDPFIEVRYDANNEMGVSVSEESKTIAIQAVNIAQDRGFFSCVVGGKISEVSAHGPANLYWDCSDINSVSIHESSLPADEAPASPFGGLPYIRMSNLACSNLTVDGSGPAVWSLNGTVGHGKFQFRDGASVRAGGLTCEDVEVTLSDASFFRTRVTTAAKTNISEDSGMTIFGDPDLDFIGIEPALKPDER